MAEGGKVLKNEDRLSTSVDDSRLVEMFEKAAEHLQYKAKELDSTKLLFFYARYKQAKEGPCNLRKPGLFDFQGKQKWAAWKDLAEMSKESAMEEYIFALNSLYPGWNNESCQEFKNPFSNSVSIMARLDFELEHSEKTTFDFVKENLLEDLKSQRKETCFDINQKDTDGLALLHWACDRGHEAVVKWLLDLKADINILDSDKQTPLHYASSCGHMQVLKLLLKYGADVKLTDDEGLLAIDVAANENVREAFSIN